MLITTLINWQIKVNKGSEPLHEFYGKSEAVPFREEDDIVLGSTSFSRWAYACSKAIDEFLGLAFYQQYGLSVVIDRFFNTIGPRQTGQYGMVVPRFVQRALNDEPILICGTGKQTRCFCYVADLTEVVIKLMNCEHAAGKVYNIGSSEEISIEELADKIIEMTGSNSQKQLVPYELVYGRPIDDMMRRVVSNLIIQAVQNKSITIYGDGAQTRSFCYVDDQIEALIRLMNSSDDLTGPIDLGNSVETSILELAHTIIELVGSSSSLEYLELPSDDPRKRCPDVSLAKEKFGWEPKVPLKEGLAKTIEYFEELLKKGEHPA